MQNTAPLQLIFIASIVDTDHAVLKTEHFFSPHTRAHKQEPSEPQDPPQSIYLEGALPHESQILVADSETVTEGVYGEELNGNADEPAVINIHSTAIWKWKKKTLILRFSFFSIR